MLTPVQSVVQRNNSNQATITVSGTAVGSGVTEVQVRFVPVPTYNGSDTGWISIPLVSGAYSQAITVDAGWYTAKAQTTQDGNVLAFTEFTGFGCGDVFIISGQSLVGMMDATAGVANTSVLQQSYLTPTIAWVPANDPQLEASGYLTPPDTGSVWPGFANAIATHTGYPVGLMNVSVGSTTVAMWQPGGVNYPRITAAVQAFPVNGFKAFLWGQGETDTDDATSQADYTSGLENIIAQSRIDAGWNVPWGIAIDTRPGEPGVAAIQAAQIAVGTTYSNCFQAADTDSIPVSSGATTYRYDGTHFNDNGIAAAVPLWTASVISGTGI